MNAVEIIKKKRNGGKLSKEEINFFISKHLEGKITDYQVSAFLMAVHFKGMDDEETLHLTELMLNSC